MNWIHHLDRGSSDLTVLLLHGTGGNEHQLMDFGRQVAPTATLLGVRGRSLEEGSPRFFRRFTATAYDQPHLLSEAAALAAFVGEAAQEYGLDAKKVVALGYSNGANIALASLAHHPDAWAGAALLRPVMPMDEPPGTDVHGLPVLVTSGERDPYQPFAAPVVPYLTSVGARVEEHLLSAGHELTPQDVQLTATWLGRL
ncbi:phospholipase/carboxylesterase [Deinococcus metalli]|uniref:Hydrolase n=1 Tax=Deinococcus metalli TaxID=1141878 RepID=A0A7W8KG59_9DEIO|nr:alpha/beta hydrolase [Deinococcus metalli]MBB5377576.1 phospholipase/carboxylesterase [Deinococcus metalli]GHF51478.1 hydrolase [Deinococcus metalli]